MQYFTINILYHLISCLLTFPHSLYLFPKHHFVTLKIIHQLLSPSPVHHSFCNLDCLFHNHSLCLVSVIGNPITSLKPFLKSSSLSSHRPTNFFIPPFTPVSSLPAFMSHVGRHSDGFRPRGARGATPPPCIEQAVPLQNGS